MHLVQFTIETGIHCIICHYLSELEDSIIAIPFIRIKMGDFFNVFVEFTLFSFSNGAILVYDITDEDSFLKVCPLVTRKVCRSAMGKEFLNDENSKFSSKVTQVLILDAHRLEQDKVCELS